MRTVVLTYDSSAITLSNVTALAGTGGAGDATNGTTYMLDRTIDDGAGTLTITSGFDFPADGDYTRDNIAISSGARLTCSSMDALTVSSTAWLSLGAFTWSCSSAVTNLVLGSSMGLSTTGTTITFSATDNFTIDAPTWTNELTTIAITKAGAYATINTNNDLILDGLTFTGATNQGTVSALGGLLLFPNSHALTLIDSTLNTGVSSTVMTSISIDADSAIDASGRGCAGSTQTTDGLGPHLTTGICTITTSGYGKAGSGGGGGGGGAAHAGTGGAGNAAGGSQLTTYGDEQAPLFPGSGGGGGYYLAGAAGGNGGGKIFLASSGILALSGDLIASGSNGLYGGSWNGGGGGSGGSIYLVIGEFSGRGSILANGGNGAIGGGGGGGGRVSVVYAGGSIGDTTITATGGAPGHSAGTDGTVYTLQTNQAPNIPASLGQSSLVNGSTTGTTNPIFTFTLSDDDVADTVQYRIQIDDSSDFSSPVVDYTSALAAQGAATFQVGQAAGSGAYTVGSVSQTLADGSYYWRVKTIDASAAESSYTTANSGSVAFIVDSATRTVSFAYSTMSSLESVTATSVRVVLDTTHFENVTVNYSVTGGTATGSGTDYTLSSGTATITAGETSTTIALVIVNDEIDEPDETFVITLADPVYATLGATDELTYTITDNDAAGITSSESAFSLSEGGASDTFTLVLTSKPTSTVTVTFTTSTAGITLVPDALAFTTDNWATPQTVTISATDDSRYESSHTTSVVMTVSGGVYGYPLITPPTITATITDNETSDITLSASTLAVTEGSFGTLTFVLASQPTSTVTLVFATPSESALSASSLTFTADNWSTSQMLTVNILNNRDYVGTRTATLTTTVTSDTTFSQVAVPTVTITINEDDAPPGGGAVTAGPGAFYVPFPLDYVPPVTTVPALPPQTGGEASSPAPVTDAPTAPSAPASNQARTQVSSDATSFRVTLAPQDQERLASFVDTGTSQATQALGSGERRALVRDALDTMGRAPTQTDLERLAQGQIPQTRNLTREREQLPRARSTFRTIYGRDPNFQNAQENLAWNTLMYRIRFTRDLAQEREGITTFRQTFRRAPSDPFQWAVVRVLGYVR